MKQIFQTITLIKATNLPPNTASVYVEIYDRQTGKKIETRNLKKLHLDPLSHSVPEGYLVADSISTYGRGVYGTVVSGNIITKYGDVRIGKKWEFRPMTSEEMNQIRVLATHYIHKQGTYLSSSQESSTEDVTQLRVSPPPTVTPPPKPQPTKEVYEITFTFGNSLFSVTAGKIAEITQRIAKISNKFTGWMIMDVRRLSDNELVVTLEKQGSITLATIILILSALFSVTFIVRAITYTVRQLSTNKVIAKKTQLTQDLSEKVYQDGEVTPSELELLQRVLDIKPKKEEEKKTDVFDKMEKLLMYGVGAMILIEVMKR